MVLTVVTSFHSTLGPGQTGRPERQYLMGVMEVLPAATDCARDWFLRPKGGTRMTAAQLKAKIRNSPFASLQTRISLTNA
jgi:hypothetical protein